MESFDNAGLESMTVTLFEQAATEDVKHIEEIVNSFEGIKQSFAVQAGREVRIIVQADMFDDLASGKLARDVAKRIEDELDYPGQIRVTVVREFRAVEIAK